LYNGKKKKIAKKKRKEIERLQGRKKRKKIRKEKYHTA